MNKYLIGSIISFFVILLIIALFLHYKKPTLPGEALTCKTILNNGDSEKKIDVIFFFDNIGEKEAEDYVDYLLTAKPFKTNKDRFNFFSINFQPKCEIKDGILICYSRDLIKASSICPNDYLIVLSKQSSSTRSSAYINLMSLNTENPKNVLIHEFGHVFANLADEYIPSSMPRGSKNCVSSCDKFKSETDGCFQGCTYDSSYRSIEAGVMRTLRTSNYGKFDKKIVEENLVMYG